MAPDGASRLAPTAQPSSMDGADFDAVLSAIDVNHIAEQSQDAAEFLKALGHDGRLMILCHLYAGERSVAELEQLLASRQAAVSQQLARLRYAGMVNTRREGNQIIYTLCDARVERVVRLLYTLFVAPTPQTR